MRSPSIEAWYATTVHFEGDSLHGEPVCRAPIAGTKIQDPITLNVSVMLDIPSGDPGM
jgi:hypothetical protein